MPEALSQPLASDVTQSQTRDARYASPVLTALRSATKTRHAILDRSMPLSDPEATWAHYVAHLQMLAAWLEPLEQWLSAFNDGPQGKQAPALIRYTDIIRADLGETYMPADKLCHNAAQHAQPDDAAYRWGVCYVIEGSQLGGEFLYKRLSTRLAPHPLKYLQCKQAGRWPEFLQAMATEVISPGQINSACEGAVNAFDALLLQLQARENIL